MSTELKPMSAELDSRVRDQMRPSFALDKHSAASLLTAHDYWRELAQGLSDAVGYYRARCPVLASDVGPEHTAARVLAYALANGWTEFRRGERYVSIVRDRYRQVVTLSEQHAVPGFCGRHAKASGMAPLDVLAAIGTMP